MDKIKIIGCGSLLMGDDAAGCIAARKLQEIDLPEHITVIEAGTPGLNLLNLMNPGERVIIIDAIVTDSPMGELDVFSQDEILLPSQMPLSAHQIAIPEALALGKMVQPELMPASIEIWGINVKLPITMKFSLSPVIEKSVNQVVKKILDEVICVE